MSTPATTGELQIDLGRLVANWRHLGTRVAGPEVAAVLKADGYGLGADRLGPALAAAGCREFFVAEPGEGVALRKVVPDADIFVLCGAVAGTEDDLEEHRLVPVLISGAQVERWGRRARRSGRALPASIHFDTGMNRAGLDSADTARLLAEHRALDGLELRHVISHLVSADSPDDPLNRRQLEAFHTVRSRFPLGRASLANSAGLGLGSDYHFDVVRPGLALYGVDPTPARTLGVEPVVTLHTTVLQVRTAHAGETVGYSGTHLVEGERRLATLAVGYGDGFSRALSGRGAVAFDGHRAPIVGRVSMDLVTVDVSDLPDSVVVDEGNRAELIGETITIDEIAEAAGTIAYEVLTNLGRRYTRRHLG